ncbi:MAG: peptide-methionine (R)-S-oxide reductase [Flavobacterium sp.]|nr:MAG: peptide-methionine (R)-S-oxide reductase [Flavobacterium sp.]
MKEKQYLIQKTEEEWLAELGPERYRILRLKGTERPFTGEYNIHTEKGVYACAACKTQLFDSSSKFDSGCGWPSFDDAIDGAVEYVRDTSHGMIRTEILCTTCGSHLGHVFNDGPTATGQRYCVNSLSVDFEQGTD